MGIFTAVIMTVIGVSTGFLVRDPSGKRHVSGILLAVCFGLFASTIAAGHVYKLVGVEMPRAVNQLGIALLPILVAVAAWCHMVELRTRWSKRPYAVDRTKFRNIGSLRWSAAAATFAALFLALSWGDWNSTGFVIAVFAAVFALYKLAGWAIGRLDLHFILKWQEEWGIPPISTQQGGSLEGETGEPIRDHGNP